MANSESPSPHCRLTIGSKSPMAVHSPNGCGRGKSPGGGDSCGVVGVDGIDVRESRISLGINVHSGKRSDWQQARHRNTSTREPEQDAGSIA
jgi:hypothetical protein